MRVLLIVLAVLLAVLVVLQIVLPRIAASQISSRIGRYGGVRHVSVSAWPAVELLWGHAGSVSVDAGTLTLSSSQAAAQLWEGRGVGRLDVHADAVRMGRLSVTDAVLRKRGAEVEAQARVTQEAANAALGPGARVQLLASTGGRVQVRVGGSLFGVGASVRAVGEAVDGKLIAHPEAFLLEGFKLKLFEDPHVHVEGVEARAAGESGYQLTMRALLR